MSTASAPAATVMERADALAACTDEPGRITRAYGTPALVEARELVRGWMEQAGMAVRQDAIGNLVGRYEADEPGRRAFALGSHIDSVRNAGRYDGPLGVLAAIACVQDLHEAGERLPFAVEVVAFADEEGLRYHAGYLGSRVYAGLFDEAELETTDADGVPLADAVRAMGGDPRALAAARRDGTELLGYCELHIEQGPLLEAEGLAVGVVTSIAGQSRGTVRFVGEAGHAGTVPMALRHDALCAAAELVLAVEATARETGGLVATVGQGVIAPGAGNVIPGEVTLSFDVRHQDDALKAQACRALEREASEIARRRGLTVEWRTIQEHPATPCSAALVAALREAARAVAGSGRLLSSGAGHDPVSMAHITDVVMLFMRCRGGISHHPDESVETGDVALAIDTLLRFLRRLDLQGAETARSAPS
jgi:allantoate deiminase